MKFLLTKTCHFIYPHIACSRLERWTKGTRRRLEPPPRAHCPVMCLESHGLDSRCCDRPQGEFYSIEPFAAQAAWLLFCSSAGAFPTPGIFLKKINLFFKKIF
jgi:hypothetical protein